MPEPRAEKFALSSALETVQGVRERLQNLHSRLAEEQGVESYLEVLVETTGFTDEMTELLTSAMGSDIAPGDRDS
jgi:hypothetical protein